MWMDIINNALQTFLQKPETAVAPPEDNTTLYVILGIFGAILVMAFVAIIFIKK
jgi:hypothetical protein